MTRYDPSLFVDRMLVLLNDHFVYDERFHRGLNLIRGENSSGKSTIADFLFYGIGGDFTAWKPEAAACDSVLVQVQINGAQVTLRREISTASQHPMLAFWGGMDDALVAGPAHWDLYPYKTSANKQSFSSLLFRTMGIPEIQGELRSRLTMHQLLRLMYVDQVTSYYAIFRAERFDDHRIRDAIGAVLCGYYGDRLYDLQFAIRDVEVELRETRTRIRLLDEVMSEAEQSDSMISLQAQLDDTRRKLSDAQTLVDEELASRWTKAKIEKEHKSQLRAARKAVETTSTDLRKVRAEVDHLQFEIEDSSVFVDSLKTTLKSLAEAESVREALGELPIHFCPVCYSELQEQSNEEICPLCKAAKPASQERTQIARMRQELALQLRESIALQGERQKRFERVEKRIPELQSDLGSARNRYDRLQEGVDLVLEVGIGEAYRQVGYLQGLADDLERQLRLVELLDELRAKGKDLAAKLGTMTEELNGEQAAAEKRREKAARQIATGATELLRQDLDREESFSAANNLQFDFGDGVVVLDGRANFSASSMVVLKNCFHLALLAASAKEPDFRYPRFLLIDNVEDKGMEEGRSHNFQTMMHNLSESIKVEHQIIATTSKIAPQFETSNVTVGDHYTHEHKSLDMPEGTYYSDLLL
ncbi:MAG: hypothetical protein V3T84_16645 [Phycisphaerales bacterium]